MNGGRLPNGKWEDNTKKYVNAWKKEIIDPLKRIGIGVSGFNPGVGIYLIADENNSLRDSISVPMAMRIIEAVKDAYRDGQMSMSPDEY